MNFLKPGRASAVGALVLLLGTALPAHAQTCPDPGSLTAGFDGAMAHVRYLADDRLEGRAVGTAGERCAADYLVAELRASGLEPAGEEGTWFHSFPVRAGAALGSDNALSVQGRALGLDSDWAPLGFSASGIVEGALAYGGHGVSSPGTVADRYTHVDLTGKIVVVESGDPDAVNGRSLRSDPHFKATVAAGRGAAALLVLLPEGAPLPDPEGETRSALPIPVAVVRGAAADQVRSAAERGAPATLRADVRAVEVDARNVVAILPGTDPSLASETVIVGAHYDHLGHGGEGSMAPDAREIHNGADDNASGTAALLEVARRLAEGPAPGRSVLFIAFTGEERGLWGSARYVAEPTVDLERAIAMLNLDMVGRLEDDALTVFGIGTAEEWEEILGDVNQARDRPLELALAPDGLGPSDHASFYGAGIPVLHFFTNTHTDYHRPSDDWEKVDAEGLEQVVDLVAGVTARLAAGGAARMALDRAEPADPHAGAAVPSSSAGSGYGPYLGSIPDMSPRDDGLRLTGVREGSPAEKGGLRAGDVVVAFGGRDVTDIYSYTYALQDHRPGDEVEIVVLRDGERVRLTVVLGERP